MTTATTTDKTATDKNEKTTETLTALESKLLRSCEASIRSGLKAYQNVGKALTAINMNRLYRATHSTFAIYCKDKWDFTTARASQLMHAYRVHQLLTMHGFKLLPVTESQCRPLVRLPEDIDLDSAIIDVWSAVVAAKVKVTAKLVSDAVDEYMGVVPPKHGTSDPQEPAGNPGSTATGSSASAEQRAEMRALKAKVAYLESALAAEKSAHQRTAQAGGLPKSALAIKLFKTGFRVLAKEMHPDVNNAPDAKEKMAELNTLKKTLLP